ncbi:hypothetical protein TNCV_3571771 [Trichonephila clavipes]|nr:hypothetical protein TNCV_3571771 [Trichonephila clavipes]
MTLKLATRETIYFPKIGLEGALKNVRRWVEIRGRKPTFCRKYKYVGYSWPTVNEDTQEALLTALQLLENNEIQLVQIYYEPVDFYGHKFGPNSIERKKAVKDIDSLLDLAQREMASRGLLDKVNMVVLSDHGMTSTDSRGLSVINLNQLIDMADIRYMVYYGATSMLLPHDGKLEKVSFQLQIVTEISPKLRSLK